MGNYLAFKSGLWIFTSSLLLNFFCLINHVVRYPYFLLLAYLHFSFVKKACKWKLALLSDVKFIHMNFVSWSIVPCYSMLVRTLARGVGLGEIQQGVGEPQSPLRHSNELPNSKQITFSQASVHASENKNWGVKSACWIANFGSWLWTWGSLWCLGCRSEMPSSPRPSAS